MKKKGFTLIELLAVIIILAIIAIITVPILLGVVEKTRQSAIVRSAMTYIEQSEKHMELNHFNIENYEKELVNGKTYQVSSTEYFLDDADFSDGHLNDIVKIKGTKPNSGIVEIGEKKRVKKAILIYDEYKVIYEIGVGYKIEKLGAIESIPTVALSEVSSNTSEVVLRVVAEDKVNNIKKITYEIADQIYEETFDAKEVNTTKKITGLEKNKEYTAKVTVENAAGKTAIATLNVSTIELEQLRISLSSVPNELVNGFYKEETVTLQYSGIAKGYYYKTMRNGTSNVNAVKTCGSGNSPGECTSITGSTSLSSGVWYYFDSVPIITYNEANSEVSSVYAAITTGYKLSATSSAVIDKIDSTKPSFEIISTDIGSTTATINIEASDTETGVASATCHYSTGESTEYNLAGSATTSSCNLTGLTPETKVNYKYCVLDGVGNKECKTRSLTTKVKYTAETHTCRYVNTYTKTTKKCNATGGNYSCTNYRCDAKSYSKVVGKTCSKSSGGDYNKHVFKCTAIKNAYEMNDSYRYCTKNSSGQYVWEVQKPGPRTCYDTLSNCCDNGHTFACNADHYGQSYLYTCGSKQLAQWELSSITIVDSCTSTSPGTCNYSTDAGKTYVACAERVAYNFSGTESSPETVTSCTTKSFTCDSSHVGQSLVSCSVQSVGWTSTGSFSSSTNQATSGTCSSSSNVGNTDVDCTRSYTYSWGDASTTYDNATCTDNTFSCNSSHSGETYVSCSGGGEYKFENTDEVTYECETSSSFTCDASHDGQKYVTNCTKRSD